MAKVLALSNKNVDMPGPSLRIEGESLMPCRTTYVTLQALCALRYRDWDACEFQFLRRVLFGWFQMAQLVWFGLGWVLRLVQL